MSVVSILKKAKGRTFEELRVRGTQSALKVLEKTWGGVFTAAPSDTALLRMFNGRERFDSKRDIITRLRSNSVAPFFKGFQDRKQTVECVRKLADSDAISGTVRRAERLLNGRFDLLGFTDLSFGEPINWHLDPVSGRCATLEHWSNIDFLNFGAVGDKKITWELNRMTHLATLGRAYWYTGDERYATCAIHHMLQWVSSNPPKTGINWASSLEVSMRTISWFWALNFFWKSSSLADDDIWEFVKIIVCQARHIKRYLSYYYSPNTHLTGEALGLYYSGILLSGLDEAADWRTTGERILYRELERQILQDGVYFERTTYYHRYTTEFYMHFLLLSMQNGSAEAPKLQSAVTSMLEHLMYLTRPDGTTPLVGDDDGGRLVELDERNRNDFRSTLSAGAAIFGRPDFKYVAGNISEAAIFLVGPEAAWELDATDAIQPSKTSVGFPAAGYFIMRDGWQSHSNYMLIDCGPHGALSCGHAHADALSFDVSIKGKTALVDPGTYTYTGSKRLRDLFRATAAHNTLVLNDEPSSVPAGTFSWHHVANCSLRRWETGSRVDFFEGEHDGFRRLPHPATHIRSILFVKDCYWLIRDRVLTNRSYSSQLHFHFAVGTQPELVNNPDCEKSLSEFDQSAIRIFSFGEGNWACGDGLVSEAYGRCALAPLATYSVLNSSTFDVLTCIVSGPKWRVSRLQTDFGRLLKISSDGQDFIDLVSIGDTLSNAELETHFTGEWMWARVSSRNAALVELVLKSAKSLAMNGQLVFESADPLDVTMNWRHGRLLIDIAEKSVFRVLLKPGEVAVVNGSISETHNGSSTRGPECYLATCSS